MMFSIWVKGFSFHLLLETKVIDSLLLTNDNSEQLSRNRILQDFYAEHSDTATRD